MCFRPVIRSARKVLAYAAVLLGGASLQPAASAAVSGVGAATQPAARRPNILFILADDLGYGDVGAFNPNSKIPTPHIDRLAQEGMRFTDAHAAGALCVPSRYGLLTGRYPFRNTGNRQPQKGALLEPGGSTLASVLRGAGYATAMVGKWHLGFVGGDQFDYAQPLRGGPVDHGFQSFFGQHASLDIPPYFFIADDRAVEGATTDSPARGTPGWRGVQGAFMREGKIAPGYRPEEVHDIYTEKVIAYLASRATGRGGNAARAEGAPAARAPGAPGAPGATEPFFLYVAFTAPHTPWLPRERFVGSGGAGLYGEFVAHVDHTIGEMLGALDRHGLRDDTLVIFTSDNGPVWYPDDVAKFGHAAAGPFRGMKSDAWEAGHRMPFSVRWPGQVAAGTTTDATVSLVDVFATLADVAGAGIPAGAAEDSTSLLPLLRGDAAAFSRPPVIAASGSGVLTIRDGAWKYIPHVGSGGFTEPAKITPQPGEPTGQLYDLAHDPAEQSNRFATHPEIVQRLEASLRATQKTSSTSTR